MTSLPQDDRGPHRQQRWVSCINAGSQVIPAYGVVQISGAMRTETVRTILQVKRPTADGHCNIVINGPLPIAVGEYGVCTNDFPAYALYAGVTPSVSEIWGSRAGSFALKKNTRGFIILGDPDDDKVRINRDPTEWMIAEAILDQDLCDETTGIDVINAKLWPRCIEFEPETVTNSRRHRGPEGSKILMARKACGGEDPCGGEEEWDIFDIELQKYCPVIGLEDRESCLVAAGLRVGGEWCPTDEPVLACSIVPYTDCDTELPACDLDWVFAPLFACCGQGSSGSQSSEESSGSTPPSNPPQAGSGIPPGIIPGKFSK